MDDLHLGILKCCVILYVNSIAIKHNLDSSTTIILAALVEYFINRLIKMNRLK